MCGKVNLPADSKQFEAKLETHKITYLIVSNIKAEKNYDEGYILKSYEQQKEQIKLQVTVSPGWESFWKYDVFEL